MSATRRRSLSSDHPGESRDRGRPSGRAKRGPGGRRARAALPAVLVLLLAACAGRQQAAFSPGQPAGQGYYRVGAPYEVDGVWYYPAVDYHYDHTGIASWYGPGYDGRLTANGEIFNMNGLSAAHTTLPLPSIVRVTNLENGRSLDLRVNDRGPFVGGRILDVSRYAAQLLGFEEKGIAPVRVKILPRQSIEVAALAKRGIIAGGTAFAQAAPPATPVTPAPYARIANAAPPPPEPVEGPQQVPPPRVEPAAAAPLPITAQAAVAPPPARSNVSPVSYGYDRYGPPPRQNAPLLYRPLPRYTAAVQPSGRIFVQAGAFSVPENAWHVRSQIAGLASVQVSAAESRGIRVYRVRLGPFANVEEANRILLRIIDKGYPGARMVFD